MTSAVVVSPPMTEWGPIQAIRSKHDKAFRRWMPHINLIYPFLSESRFSEAVDFVVNALASIKPFKVKFLKFDFFEHSAKSYTLFLLPETEPANALHELQATLEKTFPMFNDQSQKSADGFHPHLTVGQWSSKKMLDKQKEAFEKNWKPIEFVVDHVDLIARKGIQPFSVKMRVEFGQQPKPGVPRTFGGNAQDQMSITPSASAGEAEEPSSSALVPEQPVVEEAPVMTQVLARLEQWIQSHSRTHLPKTKQKLRGAIKPMCSIKNTGATVEEVIKKLEAEGYIQPATETVVRKKGKLKVVETNKVIRYPKKTTGQSVGGSFSSRSYDSQKRGIIQSEAEQVYQRCKEWVSMPLNCPKTPESLHNCLAQLCIQKKTVEVDEVINAMVARRLIDIDNEDKVTYPT